MAQKLPLVAWFLAVAIGIGISTAQPPSVETLSEGGAIAPDGKTRVHCDLPIELRMHNTGGLGRNGPGTGSGLCVFTSIEHSGRYQNEPKLRGFQRWMTHHEGGGYPAKVDKMLAQFAPGVEYLQHTGGDLEWLRAAMKTGRMVSITYAGHDMHYGANTIAHMVNLVHLDDRFAAILDNNYPGEKQLVWMTIPELMDRWLGQRYQIRTPVGPRPVGGGWAVVVLSPAPPPRPDFGGTP